jgi:molybdate transport repressor ModE-like protein
MVTPSVLHELWDTTRMRLLVEIDRQGSLSAAAAAIGIGQPSASQHLRLLEVAAGQRLVERSGRGSSLTEAGKVLAGRAAQALASLGAAEEELHALAGLQTGTIRVGASTAPGAYLLPDTLGCFRREFPGVTVQVEIAASGEILDRLVAGRVQLAIVGAQQADPRVHLDPFLEDEIVGIAKPGLLPLSAGKLNSAEIASLTLLGREAGSSSRELVERELQSIKIRPGTTWELGSTEAVKRAAREGLGIAFLSRYSVAEEVERGDLETFRLRGRPPIRRDFSIATLAGRPLSPSELGFIATLTRCCAKSAAYAKACVAA